MLNSNRRSLCSLAIYLTLSQVWADCECGYAVNSTSSPDHAVFTDFIETDFRRLEDILHSPDYQVQTTYQPYNSTSGHYGRKSSVDNVVPNPLVDAADSRSSAKFGGDAGLQLWVRGGKPIDNVVPTAELQTRRTDALYGTFRVFMKLTPVNGTTSAFFTYYNATQEIDVEMLSRQYRKYTQANNPSAVPQAPVNLVTHTLATQDAGWQKPNTSTYGLPVLAADLAGSFHEYRFDWTPDLVSFYFDGKWIWDLVENVPNTPEPLLFSHLSNGARGWSQGPPDTDAVMTIAYVKAYFNSSDVSKQQVYQKRCIDPLAARATCKIPDTVKSTGNSASGWARDVNGTSSDDTFFFSKSRQGDNSQTMYGAASRFQEAPVALLLALWAFLVMSMR